MPEGRPLVVVTRPREQSAGLVQALVAAGAEVVECPVIDIQPLAPPEHIPPADWLVFVSRNAVRHGLPLLRAAASAGKVAAVGSGTAQALAEAGVGGVLTPPEGAPAGGAGLLSHPCMSALADKSVLIVRGQGGREDLAEQLRTRGARVDYLEVYRRDRCMSGSGALARLRENGRHPVMVVTSSEGARNLFDIAGAGLADWLRELPFAAIAPRVAQALRALGARREPVVAKATHDKALAAAALHAALATPAESTEP